MLGMDNSWLLIYSKPRHELKLASRLEEMGIETYCPTLKTMRQWSDRKKKISEPLFKSYVFVRPTLEQKKEIFYVPGFSRFVHWLGKPVRVRDSEIEATKSFLNKVIHDSVHVEQFSIGQKVKIATGPLVHMDGEIKEIGPQKAILAIDSLGTIIMAEIALTDISC